MSVHAALTPGRFLLLNWFLPIVVAGMVLPAGLAAGFFAATAADSSSAIGHGELFLASGNAVAATSALLLVARPDRIMDAAIAAIAAILLLGLPSYGWWAYISTRASQGLGYSRAFSVDGGWISVALSLLVSLGFAVAASRGEQ